MVLENQKTITTQLCITRRHFTAATQELNTCKPSQISATEHVLF